MIKDTFSGQSVGRWLIDAIVKRPATKLGYSPRNALLHPQKDAPITPNIQISPGLWISCPSF
jgi:hypothetical protein